MSLYLPKPGEILTEDLVWQWYCNISIEIANGYLDKNQQSQIYEYYNEGGLLRGWRKPFFRHHCARTFSMAIDFLFIDSKKRPTILDLGCGTGTQSLLFALIGAKVFSLDMDNMALEILKKRKEFYEKQSGRFLDITMWHADVFTFDYSRIAPIDGLYSMFAFNMMQPSDKLISLVTPYMSKDSRISILDGNQSCWIPRMFPWWRRNVLSPTELEETLEKQGFTTDDHYGGVVFPPIFWCCFPYLLLSKLDKSLGSHSWALPISHQISAKRQ